MTAEGYSPGLNQLLRIRLMDAKMENSVGLASQLQKILLSCGLLAPLLALGTDWIAGRLLHGYNFAAQSMSELSATGSPTRPLVVSLTFVASVLIIVFGIGVWQAAGHGLAARIVSALLIGNAATSLIATLFFPNHFGERPVFASPGVLIMFLSVLFSVLAMVCGAVAFGGWLRTLSIAIPVAFVVLAVFRFATASPSSVGEVGSLIGSQERTMAYAFQLWIMALAIYTLLLTSQGAESAGG